MQEDEIQELVKKYLNDTASAEDRLQLARWYNAANEENIEWLADINNEEVLLKTAMYARIEKQAGIAKVPSRKVVSLWPRIAVAAAVVTLVFGAALFYFNHPAVILNLFQDPNSIAANDIRPGTNTATLTLANGQTIALSNTKTGVVVDATKLTYNDGTSLSSGMSSSLRDSNSSSLRGLDSSLRGRRPTQSTPQTGIASEAAQPRNDGQGTYPRNDGLMRNAITLTTPRGGTYQVVLPDGTKVWLNADSKISFPSKFIGKERRVLLQGEAYFAVVHNAKQPFKVESKGQLVEDIGTEFNVSAYADEISIKTTLVEGSARVSSLREGLSSSLREGSSSSLREGLSSSLRGGTPKQSTPHDVILSPNQQSILTASTPIKVIKVDANDVIAWQKGYFLFDNENIKDIMRKISRWYDVKVVYQGDVQNKAIGGTVSKYKTVSEVLNRLSDTKAVQFEIKGRTITVKPY